MKISDTTISYEKIADSLIKKASPTFKGVLDLSILIDKWKSYLESSSVLRDSFKKEVMQSLTLTDELRGPIEDLSLVEKHHDLIELLFMMIFPVGSRESDISAAIVPFSFDIVYQTPQFKELITSSGWLNDPDTKIKVNLKALEYVKVLQAYTFIAREIFDLDIQFDYPLVMKLPDRHTGMISYYKIEFDTNFMRIITKGDLPELTESRRKDLMANLADPNTWMDILPPDKFEFHGFGIIKLIDVTDQEIVSELKRHFIENESILSDTHFRNIQQRLRELLGSEDLYLGLVAFQNEDALMLNSGYNPSEGFEKEPCFRMKRNEFENTIYDCNICQTELRVIEDILDIENPTFIVQMFINYKLRSVIVAPLYYQDKLIGGLELASPTPGFLNELNAMKINAVLPLFAIAVQQTMEELNQKVQGIIKEKFTFIHPTVEWRFQQVAIELLEKRNTDPTADISDIVFENVIPLYSASDIRNSTIQRKQSIINDLMVQLKLAETCLKEASAINPMPLFNEVIFKLNKKMDLLSDGLNSEDEQVILDFLQNEIEPVFEEISGVDPSLSEHTSAYSQALDPHFGIVYQHRKSYDNSVNLIADTISSYLEAQEQMAQNMCPHYFEKHKTDGVDFNLYVGQSLISNGQYSPFCLKNLRLWQFMVMCGIVQKLEAIKPKMPQVLETAHLILIQNIPLSIRFRPDERQFDVDGSYNVRYEIMKKRIDKSRVKGTGERLTQPGKIALIYSNPKDILPYKDYIEYLQASGLLSETTEELELEDLQGIQGLKALRVEVLINPKQPELHNKVLETFPALN